MVYCKFYVFTPMAHLYALFLDSEVIVCVVVDEEPQVHCRMLHHLLNFLLLVDEAVVYSRHPYKDIVLYRLQISLVYCIY